MAPGRCGALAPPGSEGRCRARWDGAEDAAAGEQRAQFGGEGAPHLEGRGGVHQQHSRPAPLLLRAADHVEEAGLSGQPDGGLDVGDGALRMVLRHGAAVVAPAPTAGRAAAPAPRAPARPWPAPRPARRPDSPWRRARDGAGRLESAGRTARTETAVRCGGVAGTSSGGGGGEVSEVGAIAGKAEGVPPPPGTRRGRQEGADASDASDASDIPARKARRTDRRPRGLARASSASGPLGPLGPGTARTPRPTTQSPDSPASPGASAAACPCIARDSHSTSRSSVAPRS